jgi:cytosine/adenosine deaminase-related metal-dependent hydrolase
MEHPFLRNEMLWGPEAQARLARAHVLLLGLGGETGTIECGKAADILVTRKNPLDDLCALREPTHVMCRGDLVRKLMVKRIPEVDAELDAIMDMPAEALAEELARDGVA